MKTLLFKYFHQIIILSSLLGVTFLIISCAPNIISGNVIREETAKNPEAYFCPEEDCGKVLEKNIASANISVHCAFYDINLQNVINALAAKSKSVDVKVVIDSSNQRGQIKGNALREDNNNQLMHNKFCSIDGKIITTGSFNPTFNDNSRNNNNLIVIHSKNLAGNYNEEFNELWNRKFGKGEKVKNPVVYVNGIEMQNYFCPEDKCASRIAKEIKSARRSVYFMTFTFTNKDIADSLIGKKEIDIKGIFDAGQAGSNFSQLERLSGLGMNVKKDTNKYKMHHKVFIIDNKTVVTGSFNPTASAENKNDENIIIIKDKVIAGSFLKEFDGLWG